MYVVSGGCDYYGRAYWVLNKNWAGTMSDETVKIGGAFSLTGFVSAWGEADRNGAMLAVEEINKRGGINGKKVELIIEDTASDFIAPKILESDFPKRYKERFSVDSIFSASNSYDTIMMIIKAIESMGENSNAVRKYLAENEFDTVTFGKTKFDEIGGVVGGEFVIKKVVNNKAELLIEL